jgi:hypothetical protein
MLPALALIHALAVVTALAQDPPASKPQEGPPQEPESAVPS